MFYPCDALSKRVPIVLLLKLSEASQCTPCIMKITCLMMFCCSLWTHIPCYTDPAHCINGFSNISFSVSVIAPSVCLQQLCRPACREEREGGGRGARVCTVADIVINRTSKSERSLRRQESQTKEHQEDETKTKGEAQVRNQNTKKAEAIKEQ